MRVIVEFCEEQRALLQRWIDREGLALFSALCRKDLRKLTRSCDAAQLIEADCTIGNYADGGYHNAGRKAVGELLQKRGVKLPRGKRTHPALESMVRRIAPIAAAFGVPMATGDNARMVLLLRRVAAELDVPGDPRDTLRREVATDRKLAEATRALVIAAAIRGLSGN